MYDVTTRNMYNVKYIMHFSSPPCVLHTPPSNTYVWFDFVTLTAYGVVQTINDEGPHRVIFNIVTLLPPSYVLISVPTVDI
jgi:hypothetical protein